MGTKWTSIRDGYIDAITEITPVSVADPRFRERPDKAQSLRDWALNAGSAGFRRFEILRTQGGGQASFQDPQEYEVTEEIEVVVSYPQKQHNLYGARALDDLEVIMEQDSDSIRDALESAANYQSGQNLGHRVGVDVEKQDDVWFCVSRFELRYYKAQLRDDAMRNLVPIGPFSLEVTTSQTETAMMMGAAFFGNAGPSFDTVALRQWVAGKASKIRRMSCVITDSAHSDGTLSMQATIDGVAQGGGAQFTVDGSDALGEAMCKRKVDISPISFNALNGLGVNVSTDADFNATAIVSVWLWVEI